jgi:uncharacterized membrane protein
MPKEPQKTRARELAILAIPLMVSGFTWYMIPARSIALYWMLSGAIILGRAAYLWWNPTPKGHRGEKPPPV